MDEKTWLFVANLWYTGMALLLILLAGLLYFHRTGQKQNKRRK